MADGPRGCGRPPARCADRCDSSESGDSGVATLSCTDCSGSSGSDITEPGSPASSSSSGSGPEGSTPAWNWHHPQKRQRPLTDKCTNLEALISTKLIKHAASTPPSPANYNNNTLVHPDHLKSEVRCCIPSPVSPTFDMPSEKISTDSHVLPVALAEQCVSQIASIPKHIIHKTMPQQCSTSRAVPLVDCTPEVKPVDDPKNGPLKNQQVRITEYFKSQMKPTNGLNRDIAAWITRTSKNKAAANGTKSPCEATENLEKYIAFLTQTLNPKVLLDQSKISKSPFPMAPKSTPPAVDMPKVPITPMQKTEPEKLPLPRMNAAKSNLNKKTDCNKPIKLPQIRPATEGKHRGFSRSIKRNRSVDKKLTPSKRINTRTETPSSIKEEPTQQPPNSCAGNNSPMITNGRDTNLMLNSTNPAMAHVTGIPEHLRAMLVKVQTAELRTETKSMTSLCSSSSEQVPSINHHAQIHTPNGLKTPHRTENLVNSSVSITSSNQSVGINSPVMLTTIRVPDQNIQPQHIDNSTSTASHISIASQTNVNNQFVLPMMQNLNGTLLQIPGIVTKVGQSTMMSISNQNLIAQSPNNGMNHQQPQMFINGALLKLNGHMHSNLHKHIATSNLTNVSYAVTSKNISQNVPTVIGSKQSFPMNLNHPMFVSSPGFILNSMGSVVTTQTNTCISHMQQAYGSNVVLTTPVQHSVHIGPSINNSISNLSLTQGNMPISSMKFDGVNQVFITPNSHQQSFQIHSKNDKENVISNSSYNPNPEFNNLLSADFTRPDMNTSISDKCVDSDIGTSSSNITLNENSNNENNIIELKLSEDIPIHVPLRRDESIDSSEIDSELAKIDNSFIVSEETKFSVDSVSLELNRTNDTPSIDSPETEISKELDEDSLNISISTSQGFSMARTSPILSQPKTIRFPAKKHHHHQSESRDRAARSIATESKHCQWDECNQCFDDGSDLLEHLQQSHVNAQAGKETYRCLWQGCKVYNRPSCSRSWLERHVLSHGGTKVFRCIVDGCGHRFNTHLSLQKHVNNHFSESESNISSAKKSIDSNGGGHKLVKRNGKKLRYRRQPWSARKFDYFDSGMMEGLQYRVAQVSSWRVGGAAGTLKMCDHSEVYRQERIPHCITMATTILARRINEDSLLPECLIRWTPSDVLHDQWILEKDYVPILDVPIARLDASAREALYSSFCASYQSPPPEVAQSIRTYIKTEVSCKGFVKPVNGFSKVNGKKLDAHHSHNNKSKTDRLNSCVKSDFHRNSISACVNVGESGGGGPPRAKPAGAAKRKQGRRDSATFAAKTSSRRCQNVSC